MNCEELNTLLHGYLDGELDLVRSLEVEQHLKECPACSQALAEQRALRAAMAAQPLYFEAPKDFSKRVRAAVREASRAEAPSAPSLWPWLRGWNWRALLAPVAVALLVLAIVLPLTLRPSAEGRLTREIAAAHVRSLMVNHLTDVPSSDQHTVKPWFNGKLDFSPPVADLAAEGFPLVGGRLDYFGNHPVAAVVYQRRKHFINLFVWPATEKKTTSGETFTREGYHMIHWTEGGMNFWAVSDVSPGDLQEFVRLVRSSSHGL